MRRFIGPVLTVAVLLAAAPAHAFDQGSLVNASGPLGLPGLGQFIPSTANGSFAGGQGNAVSADGRYIVFLSDSDALLDPGQAASVSQGVFRRDTINNVTELVSLGPDGAPVSEGGVQSASISADGDRVAFATRAALVPADGNSELDVYVRDISDGTTVLASFVNGGGATGTGQLTDPSISGSGQFVVFASPAADLVAGDTNGSTDAFRTCLDGPCAGTTVRVSLSATDAQLDAGSFVTRPSISSTGSLVSFETNHADADGVDGGGPDNDASADIYVRNVVLGTTELVSRADGVAGTKASTGALFARISAEGDQVAFVSPAGDLDGAAEPGGDLDRDAFVRNLTTKQTDRATLSGAATQLNGDAGSVFVQTVADKVLVAFSHPTGIRVRNVTDATLTGPLYGTGPAALAGLAPDAQTTVAATNDPDLSPDDDDDFDNVFSRSTLASGVRLISRATGAQALPRGPGRSALSFGRQLSASGRYVAFTSEADALLPGEVRSDAQQIFVRDLLTGEVTLVSRTGAAGAPGNDDSESPQISADGRRVLFQTRATNLVEALTGQQIVLRDLDAATTTLVSAGPGGVPADSNGGGRPFLSSDGQVAAYTSSSDNLGFGPIANAQVIVRDLRSGTQILASSISGIQGDGSSDLPSLDADGSRVAFSTSSDNLDGNPDVDNQTVIVKDLVDNSIRVASLDAAGVKLPGGGSEPTLDDAGTRVAFNSGDKLDPQDALGTDVAVRDLAAATTTRVSRRPDGGEPSSLSLFSSLSPDGRFVTFISGAPDIAADVVAGPGRSGVYLADLQTGTLTLASRRADGALIGVGGQSGDVSAGGRCVAFPSSSRNVFADAPGVFDFSNVLVKAATGACPVVAVAPAPTPSVTPTPSPTPVVDRTKPVVSAVSVTNKRFRRSSKATAVSAQRRRAAAKQGTTFRLRLSEAATLRIVLERKETGRRVGKSCRKATRALRRRKACTRYVAKGTLTRKLTAGTKRIAFSGRVGRRAIPLGIYRARLVATDAAKNRSTERRVAFTVVRR